jgi:N-glycosylase/DNA lyase
MNKELLQKSSLALNAYAKFLTKFGVLNVKSKSQRVQRLRNFVEELKKMSRQLNELAENS